ncbi:hypothetical protein HMPREF0262_01775 [Clostridium sp. ATCC 29733]|nr:hypothetical protein HMPREF0262_01775 [Clostridium sp. ATCC 29733]
MWRYNHLHNLRFQIRIYSNKIFSQRAVARSQAVGQAIQTKNFPCLSGDLPASSPSRV